MLSLTADHTTLLKEVELVLEPVEIYDQGGKLLGLFIPANLERGKKKKEKVLSQIDWKEIERRKLREKGLYTLQETLENIKKLECEMKRREAVGEKPFTTDEALAFFRELKKIPQIPQEAT